MFRLIRLPVLLLVAFAAGVFYERGHHKELCANSGGTWHRAGYCIAP